LSGKAAKAAMFYITDYITKTDVKTHEMLLLMSKAIANTSKDTNNSDVYSANLPLHKCLSQFSHQQQIHGQQAVHYLHGKDDTMMPHQTIPMLSSVLSSHVHVTYNTQKLTYGIDTEEDEDEPPELGNIKITLDKMGRLVENNQVLDYWYRG